MTLEEAKRKADHMADGLGMPIDKKIKNLIIGLWVNGIETTGSCEGHKRWGDPFPWVDIETEEPEGLDKSRYKRMKWKRNNKKQMRKFRKLLKNYEKASTPVYPFIMWNRGVYGAVRFETKVKSNESSKNSLPDLQKQMNALGLYLIGISKPK